MAEVKWIKISTDIFDNWKIKTLKTMPEGHKLVCIWVQLLCIAGARNEQGTIVFPTQMCTTDDILATVIGEDKLIVQMALEVFTKLGMIIVDDDNSMIKIANWEEYQSVNGMEKIKEQNRLRVAKHREKKKIECNVTSNVTVTHSSYSISNSNSYSNKSNINNLNYILSINTDISNYINTNTELLNVLKEWLGYKQDKGKQHLIYAEKSLRSLIDKFLMMDKQYGTDGVAYAVKEAVMNGWQGIVWNKAEEFNKFAKKGQANGRKDELIGGYTIDELKEQGFTDEEIERYRNEV